MTPSKKRSRTESSAQDTPSRKRRSGNHASPEQPEGLTSAHDTPSRNLRSGNHGSPGQPEGLTPAHDTPSRRRRSGNHGSPEQPEGLTSAPHESFEVSITGQYTWWPIVEILSHRFQDNKHQYQIDWEPHPVTGETYVPTWQNEDDLKEESLTSYWKRRDAADARNQVKRESSQTQMDESDDEPIYLGTRVVGPRSRSFQGSSAPPAPPGEEESTAQPMSSPEPEEASEPEAESEPDEA
ncbi:hypothetical protein AYL99_11832 [Fonsecaea erecta]|uniref:Chromo domain-containing protein n=1 Tax=Fonsecaea erecta TaxID=1367422 RepID=A0A178Z2E6_9EURO|nr:hypothetical protein AYL99_11832 [Fonsecaea erecta]OAP53952.1 hypothetical protein AYL99_11832 [Fonsecaea erecta]